MKLRYLGFLIALTAGILLVGYGLSLHRLTVYQKPDERDLRIDPANLREETRSIIGEIRFTDFLSRERIERDPFGRFIDSMNEAACFS